MTSQKTFLQNRNYYNFLRRNIFYYMRKNKIKLFILFLFAITMSFGQETIRGFLENGKGEAIPYANIILMASDSTLIKGAISNDKGFFEITKKPNAKGVVLKITHLEYEEKVLPLDKNEIGRIILKKNVHQLDEVVVKASRPILKQEGTKVISNIAETSLSKLPTIDKVIDFLPGVVLNSSTGKREVFGKENPIYFINNQQVYDYSRIARISPQDIESIELETQPGATFDNTVGAIIKIKLKKKQGDGLSGTIWQLGDFRFSKGIYENGFIGLNYRKGTTDISFGMNHTSRFNTYKEVDRQFMVNTIDKGKILTFEKNTNNTKSLDFGIGIAHEFRNNQSIGINISYNIAPYTGNTTSEQEVNIYKNNTSIKESISKYTNLDKRKDLLLNVYYEGEISKKLKNQTNINFKTIKGDNTTDFIENNRTSSLINSNKTISDIVSDWIELKSVFYQNIGKSEISYGTDFSNLNYKNQYKDDILSAADIKDKELKSSVFLTFNHKFKNLNLKMGLRYEYTDFSYFENNQKQELQSRSYQNLLPNISLSFPWYKTNFAFSYAKKIRRPTFSELEDHLTYSSLFLYTKGNSNLNPQLTDEFSILSTYKNISVSLIYSYIKNGIFQDYGLYSLNPNIIEQSPRNFEDFHNLKLLVTGYYPIGSWTPKLTFSVMKHFFKDQIFPDNTPLFKIYQDNEFIFSDNWIGIFSLEYNSKGRILNENYHKHSLYTSMGIERLLCHQKLSVYLSIMDIFNTERENITIGNPLITDIRTTNYYGRSVRLTLTYNFNSTQNKYKGQGFSEEEKNRL